VPLIYYILNWDIQRNKASAETIIVTLDDDEQKYTIKQGRNWYIIAPVISFIGSQEYYLIWN
jgi:hypothetical protein